MKVIHTAISQLSELPKPYHERGNQLIAKFQQQVIAFDEFLASAKVEIEQQREEAHEKALRACRKQLEIIEETDRSINSAQDRVHNKHRATQSAEFMVRVAREQKPTVFPLRDEIKAWEESIARAEESLGKAHQEERVAEGALQSLMVRRNDLVKELERLKEEEYNLRPESERAGVPYNNFGLQGFHPAMIASPGAA